MNVVTDGFPYDKIRKVDTPFHTESTHEKELVDKFYMAGEPIHKGEL